MHVLSIIAPLLGNDHLRDTYDSVTRQVVSDPSASGHHPMRSRDLFGGGQIAAILLVYSSLFPPQSSPYRSADAREGRAVLEAERWNVSEVGVGAERMFACLPVSRSSSFVLGPCYPTMVGQPTMVGIV
jgi:hypothetical protein